MRVTGGTGGWWFGDRSAHRAIIETKYGLGPAFREGSEPAKLWLDLMTWNNVRTAVVRCRGAGGIREESGRKVCSLLL